VSIKSLLWKIVLVISIVSFLGFAWTDILNIVQPAGIALAHGVAGLVEFLRAFFGTLPDLIGSEPLPDVPTTP
jgi:hypothetical protein